MQVKTVHGSFLMGVFLFALLCPVGSAGEDVWWNDSWSFRQEIILPPVTSKDVAVSHPVDTTISFDSPCWALNETHHSVRVVRHSRDGGVELESQLYDLVYSDTTHITSCNLVFLIPPHAEGTEQYYVYYDESQTNAPEYPDYVSIEDSSYFYEPIPGYPLESHFYQISQDGSIRYIVAQEGTFLWYTTAQCVTKLAEGSTEVKPKNGVAIASFEFVYYYENEMWQYSSTSQELLSKEILCDGNLMVSCKIISKSTTEDLQTTAVYKYFYCPTSSERVQVHVVHEALKDCSVYEPVNTDGTYASLQCGGIKSASISDLNFGKIYPYYHLFSEQGTVEEYEVDLHPEYTQEDPVIHLIQTQDDVDIGTNAWVSFDEGTSGTVHALVFGSSSVVKTGVDERDGMQLKAYESNYPHLPGLDYTIAALSCTRNSYEKNTSEKDTFIPKGFTAEYDAEFFSSPVGGYPLVQTEALVFQALAPLKPTVRDGTPPDDTTSAERSSLMVYVHDAPSFPFGSVLSAVTGRYFSYITVEVYRDTTLLYSGTAGRLPFKGFTSSEDSSAREMFSAAIRSLDLRNISVFKRVYFSQLETGRYVIKVFRENSWVGNERRFIGYMVVDLTQDARVHVFCRPQASCTVSLLDQRGAGVSGAQVRVIQDGMIIAQNTTDSAGAALLTAPSDRKNPYQLTIVYNGFEVVNESIKLKSGQMVVPLKKSVILERYDWSVSLVDLWDLPPEIDVTPRLTSTEMVSPTLIASQDHEQGTYHFANLIPATYHLQIQYKSFRVEKEIHIPSKDGSVLFPAVFPISFHVFDSRGTPLQGMTIQLSRGGITKETRGSNSSAVISLPPGVYLVKVLFQGNVIGQRSIHVLGERGVDLITTQEPLFPLVVIALACVVGLAGVVLALRKKHVLYLTMLLLISVLMISLVSPWWGLHGSTVDIQTSSTLYLMPLSLVTTTTASQVIAGDHAFVPGVFSTVMTLVLLLNALVYLLAVLALILDWRSMRKWQGILILTILVLQVCSLGLFIGTMSVFTEVGVGSFIGEGPLDVSIPGNDVTQSVSCSWGPGLGFWLYALSVLFVVCTFLATMNKKNKKT